MIHTASVRGSHAGSWIELFGAMGGRTGSTTRSGGSYRVASVCNCIPSTKTYNSETVWLLFIPVTAFIYTH